jgi:hypothetical protein
MQKKRKIDDIVNSLSDSPEVVILEGTNGRIEIYRDLLESKFFEALLNPDPCFMIKKEDNKFVCTIKEDVETLRLFRSLLLTRKFSHWKHPQSVPLLVFCDMILFEDIQECLLREFKQAIETWSGEEMFTFVRRLYPFKEQLHAYIKLLEDDILENLQDSSKWNFRGADTLLDCFDTLDTDTGGRPENMSQARCCSHSLQDPRPPGIFHHERKSHRLPKNTCFNLSYRQGAIVQSGASLETAEKDYCCYHRRLNPESDIIQSVRAHNLKNKTPDLASLLPELPASTLSRFCLSLSSRIIDGLG